MEKRCLKCKEVKSLEEFPRNYDRPCGYRGQCKSCTKKRKQNSYVRERTETPQFGWAKRVLWDRGHKARRAGLNFSLTRKDLLTELISLDNRCAYCKMSLNFWGTPKDKNNSATIDRIIPIHGYSPRNITICCHRCNAIKNNASVEELKTIYEQLQVLIRERNL